MTKVFLLLLSLISLSSCGQKRSNEYPLQVGDIDYDQKIDDPDFKLCDKIRVIQYYNFSNGIPYKGEKITLDKYFNKWFKGKVRTGETGYVTIRFIVNCEGETGMFRMETMDAEYKPREFNEDLTNELLTLTRKLDGWIPGVYDNVKLDYYQYLTFKLENGELLEIMP